MLPGTNRAEPSGGKKELSADRLVVYRGAHKKIKEHEAAQSKCGLDDAAYPGIKLQQAAQRPARGPGSADHFGADEDRNRGES